MTDSLTGNLLCLFLLILINGRIFFSKHKNSITVTVLSPVVLIVSFFQILAQGCTVPALLIFALSLAVFILNIHAISRFASHLYVDRYSPVFYIFSLFFFICTIALTVLIVYFREVPVDASSYGVTETAERLQGYGKGAVLWTFKEKDGTDEQRTSEKPVILFSADKRGDTRSYRPYLILLARSGYTIYSLDLYQSPVPYVSSRLDLPFFRRSGLIYLSLKKPDEFIKNEWKFTRSVLNEYETLLKIVSERQGSQTRCFYIGDLMQEKALIKLSEENSPDFKGVFSLASVDLYKNKGYGCVTQTDPFTAYVLGTKREPTLIVPSYMVLRTKQALEEK
ncbi:hypothetical protein HRI96_11135 [Treponema parvum]|uniref:Uncharacterized protein n=1 Tax=Treponema parvum TaxID=138851 RepID=A0A975F170_9SPIR|nr:hypothetical protein [Treponema parvum]QTQ12701.1 hypothetical protein HRI96_11135 [Treponema parvum]